MGGEEGFHTKNYNVAQQVSDSNRKERFSRTLETKEQYPKNQLIIDIKKMFLKKDMLISDAWLNKIASAYKTYPHAKQLQKFFEQVPTILRKDFPKTLYATALIQYANTIKTGPLVFQDFVAHVEGLEEEHASTKRLYEAFTKQDNPAFVGFKKFKQTYKKQSQSLDEITQGKSFTDDAAVFYAYLASDSFQRNKDQVLRGMSDALRQDFGQCLQKNKRIAAITQIDATTLYKSSLGPESVKDSNKQSGASVKDIFEQDFAKQNGPKVILDSLQETGFGEGWLQNEDIDNLIIKMKHSCDDNQIDAFLDRFNSYFPDSIPRHIIREYLTQEDKSSVIEQHMIVAIEDVLKKIIVEKLQTPTREMMQKKIMQLYFDQFAAILAAGGDVVRLQNTGIVYGVDGTIDMTFSTEQGISGHIMVDKEGKIHMLDMYALGGDVEKGQSQHILQRVENALVHQGNLPSMKDMMTRVASKKDHIFAEWHDYMTGSKDYPTNPDIYVGTMLTEGDEVGRMLLETGMTRSLLMTESMDMMSRIVSDMHLIQGTPQNDIFTKYITGKTNFIDTKMNPSYASLPILRQTLQQSSVHDIKIANNAMLSLYTLYHNQSDITQATFPFDNEKRAGKETIFDLIARFCISDSQFDIQAFDKFVDQINNTSPKPTNFLSYYIDNPQYFPSSSLYHKQYPDKILVDREAEKNAVYATIGKELRDYKDEIILQHSFDV